MKILSALYEYFYVGQVHAVVSWAKHRKGRRAGESLFVSLPHREQFIDIDSAGNNAKKQVRVIVCKSQKITETLNLLPLSCTKTEKEWRKVFASPLLEVWEDTSMNTENAHLHPLRFGLAQHEKDLLLSLARASLSNATSAQYDAPPIPPAFQHHDFSRFFEVCGVDVTLWVGGRMRGSQVVEGLSLKDAVHHAVLLASEDARFKPITASEIGEMQIELTLFSDLRMPLSPSEIEKNEIYAEKGYCMKIGAQFGWFIPAVFNCRTFANLQHFLSTLQHEKVPKQKDGMHLRKSITVFEVTNFIEVSAGGKALSLRGAIPENLTTDINLITCEERARTALNFLIRTQDADGSIPLTLSPTTGQFGDIDWVRMSLTIWSIVLSVKTFPNLQGSEALTPSVQRGYAYLKKFLFTHRTLSPATRCFSLIYYHKIAVLQNDSVEMEKSHKHIMDLARLLSYEPSIYIQIALHIFEYEKRTEEDEETALRFTQCVYEDFKKKKDASGGLSTALYADLFNLLWVASEVLHDANLHKNGDDVFAWYMQQQNNDGSFPSAPHSSYAYTRGTGKILEALTKHKISCKETSFIKTFSWLDSMQYKKNNMHFVLPSTRSLVLGGFRHDHQNTSIWIDAGAHYLIALCQGVLTATAGNAHPREK